VGFLAMFTGLIEGIGVVRQVQPAVDEVRLTIEVPAAMTGDGAARLGDSVAINGCCLTVVEIDGRAWSFQAGKETLSRTNLGRLRVGDAVNLERALPATGRFGGHVVQGHVDGVGTVRAIEPHGDWIDMAFDLPAELAKQLVPKGSVAVDGVSLTVVDATATGFSVALIPHTLAETTLGQRKPGDAVNIETDILGKYVQKLLAAQFGGASASDGRG
jgi:riboflavin synthase